MQIICNVNIFLYALLAKRLYICHWPIWSASALKPIRTQDQPHLDHSRSQLLYLADVLKLVKKVQKARVFLRPISSKITIAKEKERRKRKSEEDERRRRKRRSNSCTLSFDIGLLWRQFLVVQLAVTFSKIRLVHEYDIQYVVYIQLCIDRVSLRIYQLCFKGLK